MREEAGDLAEDAVSGQVTVGIVDLLEVVHVDHQECDWIFRAVRDRHLVVEPLEEGAMVEDAGQAVDGRLLGQGHVRAGAVDGQGREAAELDGEADLVRREGMALARVEADRADRAPDKDHWRDQAGFGAEAEESFLLTRATDRCPRCPRQPAAAVPGPAG